MNDMYGRTPENLLRALPGVLRDDGPMYAIAASVADALSARQGEIDLIRIYTRIDALPERLLDALAFDFNVGWWDPDYTLEEKRRTLKGSWAVRRGLGTKAAVEGAISAVYAGTKVVEWFEYGGAPYEFKLLVDAAHEGADPQKHRRALERLGHYKNLRSSPFTVEYTARAQCACAAYAGAAAAGIYMEMTVEVKVYGLE